MPQRRSAFFISDRTGITAEMLGHSLLTQFEMVSFNEVTLPFIDTADKAAAVVSQINEQAAQDGTRPLIFSTLVNQDVSNVVATANALFLDCFDVFILPMEKELGVLASHAVGRSHSANDFANYHHRMEAVNYALSHDDAVAKRDLAESDVILVGVSRSGKTPTCLYLAMQFGIRAANYPLAEEDFKHMRLPGPIKALRKRLYGLTIKPDRLQKIRTERNLGENYASLSNCEFEVRRAEALMGQEGIPFLDVTSKSVEELATTILQAAKLTRRVY
jgi:regulator of PEP synthase PpsR (kinase-PPPase family)